MKAFVCRLLRALANAIDKAPGVIVPLVSVIVIDERRCYSQFPLACTVSASARLTTERDSSPKLRDFASR